jgi:hypothetical protein
MLWQESKGGSLLSKVPEIVSALPAFAVKVGEQLRAAEQAWQPSSRIAKRPKNGGGARRTFGR